MKQVCRSWTGRVTAWFDGECSELDAAEVRAHLMECSACRNAVADWGKLRDDLDLLQPPEPSAELMERMTRRLEEGLAGEVFHISRALRVWTVAAALLLLCALGFMVADRVLLPSSALASEPRDIDGELRELLEQPAELWPEAPDGR